MEERVLGIIRNAIKNKDTKVETTSNLTNDLELTSLNMADILVNIEEEFDIEVNDRDIMNITTVQDIIDYIKEKM